MALRELHGAVVTLGQDRNKEVSGFLVGCELGPKKAGQEQQMVLNMQDEGGERFDVFSSFDINQKLLTSGKAGKAVLVKTALRGVWVSIEYLNTSARAGGKKFKAFRVSVDDEKKC
jgi:hypothetical protein